MGRFNYQMSIKKHPVTVWVNSDLEQYNSGVVQYRKNSNIKCVKRVHKIGFSIRMFTNFFSWWLHFWHYVTATWILPKEKVGMEKECSQTYRKMKYSTNKEVNLHVHLFPRRHDGPLFYLISREWILKGDN